MCGFVKLQIGRRGKRRLYFPDKKKYVIFPPTDYLNPLPGVASSSAADKHLTRHSSHQHGAGCSSCLVPELSVCDRYGCHLGRSFLTVPSLTLGSTKGCCSCKGPLWRSVSEYHCGLHPCSCGEGVDSWDAMVHRPC